MRPIKSQSAMEYLMTYGWSILIIAVVLGVMFQLGVFSGQNLAPKAQPGSCKVVKLGSPGTSTSTNLQGVCNNLRPQYVAQVSSSGYITVPATGAMEPSSLTISAWVYISPASTAFSGNSISFFRMGSTGLEKDTDQCGSGQSITNIEFAAEAYNGVSWWWDDLCGNLAGVWYNLVMTYSAVNGADILYVNGAQKASGTLAPPLVYGSSASIRASDGGLFSIANIQEYNASLDVSAVNALYQEGIGGVPISLQNLVGWWPLNGDANDYSGNGNNGQNNGAAFTSAYSYP
jgi:hypothetical protein